MERLYAIRILYEGRIDIAPGTVIKVAAFRCGHVLLQDLVPSKHRITIKCPELYRLWKAATRSIK